MMNYNSAEQGLGDDFGNAFNDKNVRMGKFVYYQMFVFFHLCQHCSPFTGFIRKVYGILSVQLLITFGFVCALSARYYFLYYIFHSFNNISFLFSDGMRDWTKQNTWLLWVSM